MPTRSIHPGTTITVGISLIALGVLVGCSSGSSSSSPGSTTAAAAAPVTSVAGAQATIIKDTNGHLTDGTGRTVYLWVADTGKDSTCSGACAKAWPPVVPTGTPTASGGASTTDISVITRADGFKQIDYAGHPLYYFVADKTPGAQTGQGSDSFDAKWWELDDSGRAVTAAASAAAPAPTGSSSDSSGGGGPYGY